MKTTFTIKCFVMALAIICISANAQKTKKPVTNQYATIVQKCSQDIVLTNEQKIKIKFKTDSIYAKYKNNILGVKDSTYIKVNNVLRKDIIENVLTAEQKQVLRQKLEVKKQDILIRINKSEN